MEAYLNHQTQLVHFFYQLRRYDDVVPFMMELQQLLVSLKTTVIQSKNANVQKHTFDLLTYLYKFIPYTRDIYGGLGERQLTYAMIFIWYHHFPIPAIKCLHNLVLPINNNPPFGSWKDIKLFCEFVKTHSTMKENDPLIETCIGLMNHQLDEDDRQWDFALEDCTKKTIAPQTVHPSQFGISLVCKWIPRENSAFHWLFEKCVAQWIRSFKPHYFHHVNDNPVSYEKATKKGKKEYRRICSRLNKLWHVLETKQCSQQWENINFNHVPMVAMNCQTLALLNVNTDAHTRKNTFSSSERNICAQKFKNHLFKENNPSNPLFLHMGSLVHDTLRTKHSVHQRRAHNAWKNIVRQVSTFHNFIPFLDLSLFPQSSFFSAMALAAIIAIKSDVFAEQKRLFAYNQTSHFIALEQSSSLKNIVDTLKPFYHDHHQTASIVDAVEHFIKQCEEAKLSRDLIGNLRLVFFTNCNQELLYKKIVQKFNEHNIHKTPYFIFWNFAETYQPFSNELQPMLLEQKSLLITGETNYMLTRLAQLPEEAWENIHTFSFLAHLLNQPRFATFGEYFKTLLLPKDKVQNP